MTIAAQLFLSLHFAVTKEMKYKDVGSQGHLNFMKHKQATFTYYIYISLYIQVCSFSEYQSKFQNCKSIHSLYQSKCQDSQATFLWQLFRDCCYVQSLCNTPCAKITLKLFYQGGITAQWLSNPPTHTAETKQTTPLLWQHLEQRYSRYDTFPST